MSEQSNKLTRFLGKIKQAFFKSQNGETFEKLTIMIDNPYPNNYDKDGNLLGPNQYHKGMLIWHDNETGSDYLVKQIGITRCSDDAVQRGFIKSVMIDLNDPYQTQKLGQ